MCIKTYQWGKKSVFSKDGYKINISKTNRFSCVSNKNVEWENISFTIVMKTLAVNLTKKIQSQLCRILLKVIKN